MRYANTLSAACPGVDPPSGTWWAAEQRRVLCKSGPSGPSLALRLARAR